MLYQGKRFQAFSDTLQELLSQDNGLLFHMTLPMFIKQCVRLFKAASTAYFTKNHKELKTGFNQGRIQGGGAIAPPKTHESSFIHHGFVQFGKNHSRY